MTEKELQRRLEQAAKLGARSVLEEHSKLVEELNFSLMVARGLVDRQALMKVFDVSYDTVSRWEEKYEWPTYPVGNRKMYYWPEIVENLRGEERSLTE